MSAWRIEQLVRCFAMLTCAGIILVKYSCMH